MTDRVYSVSDDLAQVDRWLGAPDAGLSELCADLPFLKSEDHARDFLQHLRKGLVAVREGRTVPHAKVAKDVEERRRRFGVHAAE